MCDQSNKCHPVNLTPKKLFPRKCEACGDGMFSGYIIGGGENYFCSDNCLHTKFTKKEWKALYNNGNSESYYTEWSLEDIDTEDEPIYEKNLI